MKSIGGDVGDRDVSAIDDSRLVGQSIERHFESERPVSGLEVPDRVPPFVCVLGMRDLIGRQAHKGWGTVDRGCRD
jgi:hypothetical protein